jgi:hypothetical protein
MGQRQNTTLAPNKLTGNNPERGRPPIPYPDQHEHLPATPYLHNPTSNDLSWPACITAAAEASDKQYTTMSCKRKKHMPTPIIPKSIPRIEREIIITCNLDTIPVTDRKAFLDMALIRFNLLIVWSAEIDLPPSIFAWTNSNNKLVLTTNHTTPVAAYKLYLQLFTNHMSQFKPTASEINTHWSKFLVYNIPTDICPSVIRDHIELIYPTLPLVQIPC